MVSILKPASDQFILRITALIPYILHTYKINYLQTLSVLFYLNFLLLFNKISLQLPYNLCRI